jgi:hypothetical protein
VLILFCAAALIADNGVGQIEQGILDALAMLGQRIWGQGIR